MSDKIEDDPFDQIANLNADSYNRGFIEGKKSGEKEAIIQGYKLG